MLQGIIFDWDGVIIDSRVAHAESWERLSKEYGKPLPHNHMERGFGKKNSVIIPEILQWTTDLLEIEQLGERKEALYRKILTLGEIKPIHGVRPLLQKLFDANIPCAVGSSTARANIVLAMHAMDLNPYFVAIASGEDVRRSKPAPDVFLLAAQRIHAAPENCIVFEDAPFGIEAARAAGMGAVGVLTSHPATDLPLAHFHVNDLSEISLEHLTYLMEPRTNKEST